MIRVLVCDDHLIVRQGIKQILADAADIAVAGEAANGPDALAAGARAAASTWCCSTSPCRSATGWTC